jgi:glycerol kinase
VDGGVARNDTLLQFQADLLEIPVVRSASIETTSLGAALLSGLAVGFWKNTEEIESRWKVGKEFCPRRPRKEVENLRGRWHQALGRQEHGMSLKTERSRAGWHIEKKF